MAATAKTPAPPPTAEEEEAMRMKKIADYLRKGLPVRHAIERLPGAHHDSERRSEYFKGQKLVDFLLDPTAQKNKKAPKVKDQDEAIEIGKTLLRDGFFHKCLKVKKGEMEVSPNQRWEEGAFYSWDYEGSKTFSNLMTGLLIVGFLTVTCFPIWPQFLKVWLWYLSVTLLVVMTVFLFVRFVLFLSVWVCGYEFWLLPRLFDDTLSFTESFKPGYSWEKVPEGQHWWRGAVVVALIAFFYWAYNQPTDFDTFLTVQKDFLDDLYSGKMLADVSQMQKDNIDKVHIPTMEELMQDDESAARDEAAAKKLEAELMAAHGSLDAAAAAEEAAAEARLEALLEANEDEDPQDLDDDE